MINQRVKIELKFKKKNNSKTKTLIIINKYEVSNLENYFRNIKNKKLKNKTYKLNQ